MRKSFTLRKNHIYIVAISCHRACDKEKICSISVKFSVNLCCHCSCDCQKKVLNPNVESDKNKKCICLSIRVISVVVLFEACVKPSSAYVWSKRGWMFDLQHWFLTPEILSYIWRKFYKNERCLCLATYILIKLSQILCPTWYM